MSNNKDHLVGQLTTLCLTPRSITPSHPIHLYHHGAKSAFDVSFFSFHFKRNLNCTKFCLSSSLKLNWFLRFRVCLFVLVPAEACLTRDALLVLVDFEWTKLHLISNKCMLQKNKQTNKQTNKQKTEKKNAALLVLPEFLVIKLRLISFQLMFYSIMSHCFYDSSKFFVPL